MATSENSSSDATGRLASARPVDVTVAAVWRSTRREVHWEVSGSAAGTGEPFRVQVALASWQDAQGDAGELVITGSFGTGRLAVQSQPVSFPAYLTTLKEPDLWRLLFRAEERFDSAKAFLAMLQEICTDRRNLVRDADDARNLWDAVHQLPGKILLLDAAGFVQALEERTDDSYALTERVFFSNASRFLRWSTNRDLDLRGLWTNAWPALIEAIAWDQEDDANGHGQRRRDTPRG